VAECSVVIRESPQSPLSSYSSNTGGHGVYYWGVCSRNVAIQHLTVRAVTVFTIGVSAAVT
jgi:hypothetical protein